MAQKREYTCDVCGNKIRDPSSMLIPGTYPGIGIVHGGNYSISSSLCINAERHICLLCLSALQKLTVEPGTI